MSVKIRLKRAGTKGRPFYRVVVIDSRMQRDGRFIEELGYYDPLEKPQVVNVDRDKAQQWMEQGALPSDTVKALLKRPNTTIAARERNRDFTPGPPRARSTSGQAPMEAAMAAATPGPERGGRGGRGGGGGRGGRGGREGGRGGHRG